MRLTVARLSPGGCAPHPGAPRDPHTCPPSPPKRLNTRDLLGRGRLTQPQRTRTAVLQRLHTTLAIAPHPLAGTLAAEAVLGCRLAQTQPTLPQNTG